MDNTDKSLTEIVAKDVPVLEDFLKVLSSEAKVMEDYVDNILKRVENDELPTINGISLLDLKYHSLASYIMDILLIIKMKVQGKSISNCRARDRLIETRTVLEKIQPLEHKMKYQINKLLRQSANQVIDDPLSLKPNVDDLDNKLEDSDNDDGDVKELDQSKKYVPPQIAALNFDMNEDKRDKDNMRARERALRKSSIISELAQETSEGPLELTEYSAGKKKIHMERSERTRYEEVNMMRINVTKKERNTEKRLLRRSELDTIANFGDISVLDDRSHSNQLDRPKKRKTFGKYKSGKKPKRFRK